VFSLDYPRIAGECYQWGRFLELVFSFLIALNPFLPLGIFIYVVGQSL